MELIVCIGLLLPLLGFLILTLFNKEISRKMTGILACSTIFLAFLCFCFVLIQYLNAGMEPHSFTLFSWIPIDSIKANVGFQIDSLSLLMTLIITGIGFLIHVYSIGYMDHDDSYVRFFAFLNFFIFSMLILVLANDLLLLFVGWEGVGLASYLLIGFWFTRPAAARAATKAFVVNRIGDCGFLIGLLLTYYLFGTSDINVITEKARDQFAVGAPIITILTLLYFIGATGKSAQIPLYTWLPDAMEGPTPVSALIHAATMVTAGVYLVVRLNDIFLLSPFTLNVIGVIGALTAIFAAICALGQTDLKRVLAYSTVSQLGFMFLACGAGAFFSAMFHLTMHAFIKALLFLSAGNVVHMMHGETEMAKMGGLAHTFKKTNWLFLIGVIALAGIPPFAAFFSKDLILEQEYLSGHQYLFYVGLAASVLTGFYLMRAYCLTFLGKPSEALRHEDVKEAPPIMIEPVGILAILSTIGGILGFTFGRAPLLETFLNELGITPQEHELHGGYVLTPETWMAVGGAIIALIVAYIIYTKKKEEIGSTWNFLKQSFYINEIYWAVFVVPLKALANWLSSFFEIHIFEGSLDEIKKVMGKIAKGFQQLQSGQIRSYVAWMAFGAVFLLAYLVF